MADEATKKPITATGRRKESTARIWLTEGDGTIIANGRPFNNYFTRENNRLIIVQPIECVKLMGKLAIRALLDGGGMTGQAGALRHAIARALVKMDETLKPALKKGGFLTRDPRMRERKKYGRKRARRRFQFTKR